MTATETSNQNFYCNICQSHFDVEADKFINHLKAHTKSKPNSENQIEEANNDQNAQEIKCEICDQRFSDQGSLTKHVRRNHKNVNSATI